MSPEHWNVAAAKAELSRVIRQAQSRPQVLESRGEAVAVVLGIRDYERVAEAEAAAAGGWREALRASASLRAEGGATLAIPRRRPRRPPLLR